MPNKALKYNAGLLSEENVKKYVLPEYKFNDPEVSQIKFKDSDKQRAVYRVESDRGVYCLKKMYFPEAGLLYVYSAIEWFYRKNINVPKILSTRNNGRFVNYEGMLFILTPWIEGEKCSYDNIEQILSASENLAKMHIYAKSFKPIAGSADRQCMDDLSKSISKHFMQLLNCFNLAMKYEDKFSKLFLTHFNENFLLAKASVEISSPLNSSKLVSSLCHLDYVNKNIIFDEHSSIWIIDFDKCGFDYCVHDISYFLRRMLKRDNTTWDLEMAINCLNSYEKIRPLNLEEYRYILSYLAFPQKFWKISRDYYNNIKKCNHHSFYCILSSSVEKEQEQTKFVHQFKRYVEEKFSVKL